MIQSRSRFLRFAMVGCIGFAVDAGLTLTMTEQAGIPPAFARVPAFMLAAIVTYLLNRRWTFATGARPSAKGYLAYMLATSAGMAVNYLTFLAVAALAGGPGGILLAVSVGSVAGMAVNYLSTRSLMGRAVAIERR